MKESKSQSEVWDLWESSAHHSSLFDQLRSDDLRIWLRLAANHPADQEKRKNYIGRHAQTLKCNRLRLADVVVARCVMEKRCCGNEGLSDWLERSRRERARSTDLAEWTVRRLDPEMLHKHHAYLTSHFNVHGEIRSCHSRHQSPGRAILHLESSRGSPRERFVCSSQTIKRSDGVMELSVSFVYKYHPHPPTLRFFTRVASTRARGNLNASHTLWHRARSLQTSWGAHRHQSSDLSVDKHLNSR